jgi:dihydroxyacetone kinase-like predicted kinase
MGRTVPTYRLTLESIIQSWSEYRRALPKADREVFDQMVNRARMHASASTYAAFTDPVEGALLSILLEQEKELRKLRKHDEGLDPGLLPGL